MEIAALLCLAEAQRKKGGILAAPSETLAFVSKLYYPLWMVPWEDDSVIVDGLRIFSCTLTYMKPPDIEFFIEHIKRSTSVRELYRSVLKAHAQTFKDFLAETHITIEGIISDKQLLSAIFNYVERELQREGWDKPKSSALILPRLDKKAAEKTVEKLVQNWMQIQSEIKGLSYAIEVLKKETSFHEEKILQEIGQIEEIYQKELSRIKPQVNRRVQSLMRERDIKLESISKASLRELRAKLREKKRLENELEKLERRKNEYEKRREIRKSRKDEVGVARWNYRIKECENKISEVRGRLQAVSAFIEYSRREHEAAISKLKQDYQVLINRENKKITELESMLNSEVQAKRKEIEELHVDTSAIITHIKELIKRKQERAASLKRIGIPLMQKETTLVYVPFYLIQYQSESEIRYHIHAPAVATDYRGILMKIQKAFRTYSLEARINLLLRPRAKALNKMFSSVVLQRIREDRALSRVFRAIGRPNNILDAAGFKEKLRKGLEELRSEGWIKHDEEETIVKVYAAK